MWIIFSKSIAPRCMIGKGYQATEHHPARSACCKILSSSRSERRPMLEVARTRISTLKVALAADWETKNHYKGARKLRQELLQSTSCKCPQGTRYNNQFKQLNHNPIIWVQLSHLGWSVDQTRMPTAMKWSRCKWWWTINTAKRSARRIVDSKRNGLYYFLLLWSPVV